MTIRTESFNFSQILILHLLPTYFFVLLQLLLLSSSDTANLLLQLHYLVLENHCVELVFFRYLYDGSEVNLLRTAGYLLQLRYLLGLCIQVHVFTLKLILNFT